MLQLHMIDLTLFVLIIRITQEAHLFALETPNNWFKLDLLNAMSQP